MQPAALVAAVKLCRIAALACTLARRDSVLLSCRVRWAHAALVAAPQRGLTRRAPRQHYVKLLRANPSKDGDAELRD